MVRLRTPHCVRFVPIHCGQLPRALGFSGGDDDFAGLGAVPPFERRFYQCIFKSGMRDGGRRFCELSLLCGAIARAGYSILAHLAHALTKDPFALLSAGRCRRG